MQPYQVKRPYGIKSEPQSREDTAGGLLLYESRERERKPTFDVVHFSFKPAANPG